MCKYFSRPEDKAARNRDTQQHKRKSNTLIPIRINAWNAAIAALQRNAPQRDTVFQQEEALELLAALQEHISLQHKPDAVSEFTQYNCAESSYIPSTVECSIPGPQSIRSVDLPDYCHGNFVAEPGVPEHNQVCERRLNGPHSYTACDPLPLEDLHHGEVFSPRISDYSSSWASTDAGPEGALRNDSGDFDDWEIVHYSSDTNKAIRPPSSYFPNDPVLHLYEEMSHDYPANFVHSHPSQTLLSDNPLGPGTALPLDQGLESMQEVDSPLGLGYNAYGFDGT
ncbi:hypothetical protein MMC28_003889 [Mycoblastus sanguinarius]|nr:hypothetical protein [Mycoblastus sanguinarius]